MDSLAKLIEALRGLPGVGPKSAQRMAYQLLKNRSRGFTLANCLHDAMSSVVNCTSCNTYSSKPLCKLCMRNDRDNKQLCVVESPGDVDAIEHTGEYNGTYYVLMGNISPMAGIGPEELGIHCLLEKIQNNDIQEVIFALSPTLEGRTTVHFIENCLRPHSMRITQLAHGIPSGGSLEFLDGNTIGSAMRNRVVY